MAEFYSHLRTVNIKAEGLQQAQRAMLEKKVRIEHGNLHLSNGAEFSPQPDLQPLVGDENIDFSHPYYWSAFTLIGSSW